MPPPTDLLQGTLDMLILKALAGEPQHGWAIAQRIQQISDNVLQIGQGSLYPALHRLEYKGWIRAQWGASENNRKRSLLFADRGGPEATGIGVGQLGPSHGRHQSGAGEYLRRILDVR